MMNFCKLQIVIADDEKVRLRKNLRLWEFPPASIFSFGVRSAVNDMNMIQ